MNYPTNNTIQNNSYFRHPLNKSLLVTKDQWFYVNEPNPKAFPIFQQPGSQGVVLNDLDRLYRTLTNATNDYSKVFAFRLDLHFPTIEYWPESYIPGNEVMDRFLKKFDALVNSDRAKARLKDDYNSHQTRYVWTREISPKSGRPHYHMVFLLNGHVFNRVGKWSSGFYEASLWGKIVTAWTKAIRLSSPEYCESLVQLPKNASFMLSRSNLNNGQYLAQEEAVNYVSENYGQDSQGRFYPIDIPDNYHSNSFDEFMFRCSYMCKVDTKQYGQGIHRIGSSKT